MIPHDDGAVDSPTERARCCEICAQEFEAVGDVVHAAECREREAEILGTRRQATGLDLGE